MEANIESVIEQHAEEATFLWMQRDTAVHAPNYSPQQFADLDERLEAQIDGLRVAGEEGWKLLEAELGDGGPDVFFPAGVLAVEAQDPRFDDLVERAAGAPEVVPGLISALGWVSSDVLDARAREMLDDPSPVRQKLGLAAYGVHRQDPGRALDRCLTSSIDSVRIRAYRVAGELGRTELLPACRDALVETKPELRFWAARSAVLLGDRARAVDALAGLAVAPGARQVQALQLALMPMDPAAGRDLIERLTDIPDAVRLRIIGAGVLGDPREVPWLLEQMEQPAVARVAAEAFVNITGADFNLEELEGMPPDDFEDGPTEDPDDENVELPEDIALPWPRLERVKRWWTDHRDRFQPDTRYFLGQAVSTEHCTQVLKEGFQRQRVAAASYLSLLQPGSPLFNTSAPAWRQWEKHGRRQ